MTVSAFPPMKQRHRYRSLIGGSSHVRGGDAGQVERVAQILLDRTVVGGHLAQSMLTVVSRTGPVPVYSVYSFIPATVHALGRR